MNPEIKERWIAKLESGEITQLQGILGNVDGERCCLGVLCDLAVEDGIIDPPRVTIRGTLNYEDNAAVLPESVAVWAGFSEPDSYRYNTNGGYDGSEDGIFSNALSADNDNGVNFLGIAQKIRENF